MKFKSMIAVLAISMAVLMTACGTGADSSSAPEATPVASATPAPTETPAPTDEPGTLEFDFDISVETYKVTQGVTEEELLADQAKKEGMFEWFYDGAVNYAQALLDKDNGCENVFLDEYIQWAGDKAKAENPEAIPTPQPETTDKNPDYYDENGNLDWDKLPRDENGNINFPAGTEASGLDQPENSMTDEEHEKMNEEFTQSVRDTIVSGEADKIIQEVNERLESEGYTP